MCRQNYTLFVLWMRHHTKTSSIFKNHWYCSMTHLENNTCASLSSIIYGYAFDQKNTERHTAHTIVLWPNPKQWVIVHTSDLMMVIRQSLYILSITTREIGKLKTHSPMYCIMDNWDNMPYLTHTLDKLYSIYYGTRSLCLKVVIVTGITHFDIDISHTNIRGECHIRINGHSR